MNKKIINICLLCVFFILIFVSFSSSVESELIPSNGLTETFLETPDPESLFIPPNEESEALLDEGTPYLNNRKSKISFADTIRNLQGLEKLFFGKSKWWLSLQNTLSELTSSGFWGVFFGGGIEGAKTAICDAPWKFQTQESATSSAATTSSGQIVLHIEGKSYMGKTNTPIYITSPCVKDADCTGKTFFNDEKENVASNIVCRIDENICAQLINPAQTNQPLINPEYREIYVRKYVYKVSFAIDGGALCKNSGINSFKLDIYFRTSSKNEAKPLPVSSNEVFKNWEFNEDSKLYSTGGYKKTYLFDSPYTGVCMKIHSISGAIRNNEAFRYMEKEGESYYLCNNFVKDADTSAKLENYVNFFHLWQNTLPRDYVGEDGSSGSSEGGDHPQIDDLIIE